MSLFNIMQTCLAHKLELIQATTLFVSNEDPVRHSSPMSAKGKCEKILDRISSGINRR